MDEIPTEPFQSTVETIGTAKPSRWRMVAATATGSVALLGVATGIGYAAAGTSSAGASGSTTTTTAPSNQKGGQDVTQRETQRLDKLLQPLVDKGTITAAQRDAVVSALVAAGPKGGGFGGGRGPRAAFGGAMGLLAGDADAAAKAIGISTSDLKQALLGGQSLADIAKAHGVDPQKVIDALVAATKAQIAAHPRPNGAAGPTDAEITQRITALVNGTLPKFPGRFGKGGPGGWGGPGGPGDGNPPSAPTPPGTPTTTAPSSTTTAPPTTTTEPATTTTS